MWGVKKKQRRREREVCSRKRRRRGGNRREWIGSLNDIIVYVVNGTDLNMQINLNDIFRSNSEN